MIHQMHSIDCACTPDAFVPCDDCDMENYYLGPVYGLLDMPDVPGCWKCFRGLKPIARGDAKVICGTVILVHRG
jgi:hypothetical protein